MQNAIGGLLSEAAQRVQSQSEGPMCIRFGLFVERRVSVPGCQSLHSPSSLPRRPPQRDGPRRDAPRRSPPRRGPVSGPPAHPLLSPLSSLMFRPGRVKCLPFPYRSAPRFSEAPRLSRTPRHCRGAVAAPALASLRLLVLDDYNIPLPQTRPRLHKSILIRDKLSLPGLKRRGEEC